MADKITSKKRKKIKKNTFQLFKIVGYVSIFLFLLFFVLLYRLDVLPIKYFSILFGIFFFIEVISIISIHCFKRPLKIACFIVVLIFSILFSAGCYYSYYTNAFLNRSFRSGSLKQSTAYYVITGVESEIQGLSDISDSISYLSNAYLINEAMESLKAQKDVTMNPYDDVLAMFQDLNTGTISSVLVEQTSYDLTISLSQEFTKEQFRVLYEFTVSVEIENQAGNNDSGKYNIYIGGNDFSNRMMDFNMIVTLNTNTHQILMTSIPRDYYIPVDGYGERKDTLSCMGSRGIDTNMKSLQNFFDIPIDYFIKINTESLVGIVDEVGGINYCSETSYTTTHALILNSYDDSKGRKLNVQKGCQKFNGIEALTVARERKAFPDGDRQRQKNCQKIIMAIFEQLISTNTITNYNNILNSLNDLYQTSIPREVISELVKETINGASWRVDTQSVDGYNGQGYVHLTNIVDYVMNPNMDTVEEAKNNILNLLK